MIRWNILPWQWLNPQRILRHPGKTLSIHKFYNFILFNLSVKTSSELEWAPGKKENSSAMWRKTNQTRWQNDSWIGGHVLQQSATYAKWWFTQHEISGSASASVTFDSRKGGLQVELWLMLRSFMLKKLQQRLKRKKLSKYITNTNHKCHVYIWQMLQSCCLSWDKGLHRLEGPWNKFKVPQSHWNGKTELRFRVSTQNCQDDVCQQAGA